MGYYQGSTVVSIRSAQDLKEIWQDHIKGTNIVLWCDGLRQCEKSSSTRKRKRVDSDDCELKSTKKIPVIKEREKKLDEAMDTLEEKHGQMYTQMQYRIWGEMYVGGYHKSLADPPTTSMFDRAGGNDTRKKKVGADTRVVETFAEVAKHLTNSLSPAANSTTTGTSPARAIEGRSKCYKQLVELKNLKVTGILSEEEYQNERDAIMASLKKL